MKENVGFQRSVRHIASNVSALDTLVKRKIPKLRSSSAPWLFGTPILLVFLLCAVAYSDVFRSPLILGCMAFGITAGFSFMWFLSSSWERDIRRAIFLVQESRLEVLVCRNRLEQYMKDLESRVSRYFHSVSQSKVRSYFELYQVRNALDDRINVLEQFIEEDTPKSLRLACECLKQPLRMTSGADERISVPFNQLADYLADLMNRINHALDDLEGKVFVEGTSHKPDRNNLSNPDIDEPCGVS